MAEKVTGKDLKQLRQPDEFQVVAGRALEWILARQRQLALAAGALIAVALIAWAAATLKQHRETNAGEALAEALRIEARPVAGEGFAQPGEETFPSKAERTKAATDALEKVRKEHAGSTAAQSATLQLGLLKQQTGDAAGATPLLQDFLKDAGTGHPMRAVALEALGYAQEAQGKLAEARDSFGKLREAGAPERGAYQLARLDLVENKPAGKDAMAAVAKDYPKDPVALEANMRLEVAGIALAPPGSVKPAAPPTAESPKAAPAAKKPVAKKAVAKKAAAKKGK